MKLKLIINYLKFFSPAFYEEYLNKTEGEAELDTKSIDLDCMQKIAIIEASVNSLK